MRMDFDLSDTEFQNKRRFEHEATEVTEEIAFCTSLLPPFPPVPVLVFFGLGETPAEVCPSGTA